MSLGAALGLTWLFGAAAGAQVTLYTMGQGDHPFERFGHAAICVSEPRGTERERGRVRCYNYGTTDFGSPPETLAWAFLRGNARFWVSVWPEDKMLAVYRRADRDVYRQALPLTPAQASVIVAKLARDSRPENRTYLYHHFTDNCATRLRDLLDGATGGALSRDSETLPQTYRSFAREGLADQTLLLGASDLLLGRSADRPISEYEGMFLPDVLRAAVERRLHAPPELVHRRSAKAFRSEPGMTSRGSFGLLALLLGLPLLVFPRVRAERLRILPGALVLGGLAMGLWGVAGATTVPDLRINESLLVFWPTDVLVPVLSARWRRVYAAVRVVSVCLLALLLATGVLKQPLHAALLLPFMFFALIRYRTSSQDSASATELPARPSTT
jgi:hypothetical protein